MGEMQGFKMEAPVLTKLDAIVASFNARVKEVDAPEWDTLRLAQPNSPFVFKRETAVPAPEDASVRLKEFCKRLSEKRVEAEAVHLEKLKHKDRARFQDRMVGM